MQRCNIICSVKSLWECPIYLSTWEAWFLYSIPASKTLLSRCQVWWLLVHVISVQTLTYCSPNLQDVHTHTATHSHWLTDCSEVSMSLDLLHRLLTQSLLHNIPTPFVHDFKDGAWPHCFKASVPFNIHTERSWAHTSHIHTSTHTLLQLFRFLGNVGEWYSWIKFKETSKTRSYTSQTVKWSGTPLLVSLYNMYNITWD